MAYTHPASAKATSLPSALAGAAPFDPRGAAPSGEVIATEMNALALHVFKAPGVNLARLPRLADLARTLPAAVRDDGEGRQCQVGDVHLQLRQRRFQLREPGAADRRAAPRLGLHRLHPDRL